MHSKFSGFSHVCLLTVSILAGPVSAHHGWAGNEDAEFDLTGTVEQGLSLAGPHATMKIRADGQVWDLTLAPPARTERAALTRPSPLCGFPAIERM